MKRGEKMALKRMSIKVSEEMYSWVSEEAEKRGLTMNAVVIFALETYYNQQNVMPQLSALKELYEKMSDESKND